MADKQAYLAARYMSGPKADAILARTEPTMHKKKKRKLVKAPREVTGGIGVVDEDAFAGFGGNDGGEEEEVDAPVIGDDLKSFQRAKKSAWQTKTSQGDQQPADQPGATGGHPSEDPLAAAPPVIKKRGGLLTASELREEAAALEARRAAEESARAVAAAAAANTSDDASAAPIDPRQTVYRDKSGAIIDVAAAERAERVARAEEVRKEKEKKEWGKGLVQRSAKESRAKKEQSMGKKDVARYANDKDMNDELRAVERADDPAAAFLTKRKSKGPQRPKYTGPPAPPNRFNILPGYRWDGVDRSTGFEAKLFQTMNNRRRREVEANAWSMEDM